MRKAIKQRIKELQKEMDKICPEGKSLWDLHSQLPPPNSNEFGSGLKKSQVD